MCSIGDDAFDAIENAKYMPTKEKPSLFDKCNKCREAAPCVVLRSKDKYCKTCFLAGTTHKFKALLGKHKLIRPNDRVLVIHKGGYSSTALLHFIRTGLDLDKKLRFEPVVIFIEEQVHLPVETRQELVANIVKEVEDFKFPIFLASLAQLIASSSVESCVKNRNELLGIHKSDKRTVDQFLEIQSNYTNRIDFLTIIKRKFWIDIAKYLQCKFVFTPELSSDIASQILIDVSLGRGPHIPLDTGFCDSRDNEVKILRPLRLFDAKELVFYNHFNNLEPTTFKAPKEAPYKSIQNLMKKFVNELQVNYPATVTTILKTGDKLSVDSNLRNSCNFCGVCKVNNEAYKCSSQFQAPIGEEKVVLNSAESTRFSHWVSTQASDYNSTPQKRYEDILASFENLSCNNYCFSCQKLKIL